eukprot:359240-Chlamydomonas_euryale.AAC.16
MDTDGRTSGRSHRLAGRRMNVETDGWMARRADRRTDRRVTPLFKAPGKWLSDQFHKFRDPNYVQIQLRVSWKLSLSSKLTMLLTGQLREARQQVWAGQEQKDCCLAQASASTDGRVIHAGASLTTETTSTRPFVTKTQPGQINDMPKLTTQCCTASRTGKGHSIHLIGDL